MDQFFFLILFSYKTKPENKTRKKNMSIKYIPIPSKTGTAQIVIGLKTSGNASIIKHLLCGTPIQSTTSVPESILLASLYIRVKNELGDATKYAIQSIDQNYINGVFIITIGCPPTKSAIRSTLVGAIKAMKPHKCKANFVLMATKLSVPTKASNANFPGVANKLVKVITNDMSLAIMKKINKKDPSGKTFIDYLNPHVKKALGGLKSVEAKKGSDKISMTISPATTTNVTLNSSDGGVLALLIMFLVSKDIAIKVVGNTIIVGVSQKRAMGLFNEKKLSSIIDKLSKPKAFGTIQLVAGKFGLMTPTNLSTFKITKTSLISGAKNVFNALK
jgi:hypothetical protein|uniref:Uncharacterized protein n=1 Tax=viral metagenome TaxID=1070528 RepID=A0A6C0IWF0_9ZZZZ